MIKVTDIAARVTENQTLINAAIARVMERGWFVMGPEVRAFEEAFARYNDAAFCVSVANGTDALELALRGLSIGPGKRVGTVANAAMYTATATLLTGALPLFMDVDEGGRCVAVNEVEKALAAGADAIVVTHLYGEAAPDIREIAALCRRHNVPLVEDCAQAHGARIHGKRVGSFGDLATFSFYPTKNLGALGDGGAVITSSEALHRRIGALRQYGWSSKYCVEVDGARNSRLDEIQAAILTGFLATLEESNARRRIIASRYAAGIDPRKAVTPKIDGENHVAHLYVIESDHRDELRAHLLAHGVGCDIHYPIPDHRQPVFGGRYDSLSLPNTERLARRVLTLPCYPEMTEEQVDMVLRAIDNWRP